MTRAEQWPGEPVTWLLTETADEIADTVGYLELTDAGQAHSPADPPSEELVAQLAGGLADLAAHLEQLARRFGIDLRLEVQR